VGLFTIPSARRTEKKACRTISKEKDEVREDGDFNRTREGWRSSVREPEVSREKSCKRRKVQVELKLG